MGRDLIVIGASMGGIEALKVLLRDLPADLPACVCIVLHLPPTPSSILDRMLQAAAPLPVAFARDGDAIARGRVYLAPADRHLVIGDGRVKVVMGPKENNFRPAVDPLFRSAAWKRGPRSIGVILSGALDCGTAGLIALKRRGGLAVVQDPADAIVPDMPLSALENVAVDHTVPVAELGPLLAELSRQPAARVTAAPRRLIDEAHIDEMAPDVELRPPVGQPVALTCPACAGPLSEVGDGPQLRFRCLVGHGFGGKALSEEQALATEGAFWAALRALEEQAALARRLASRARAQGQSRTADGFAARAETAEHQAHIVREQLLEGLAATATAADEPPAAGAGEP